MMARKLIKVSVILFGVSLFSTLSFALTSSELQSKFNCSTDVGESVGECIYVPENTTNIEQIVNTVKYILFDGFSPVDGFINVINGTTISFWHPDKMILEQMKKAIVQADRLPSFTAGAGGVIDVQLDVFAIEEKGFDHMLFELQPYLTKGPMASPSNDRVSGGLGTTLADVGSYMLNLAFGNLTSSLFKLKLDFSKIDSWTSSVNTMTARVYNNEQLNLSDTKSIFTTDSQINREKADVGLSAYGTVIQDSRNKNIIRILNLNVGYGLATNDQNSLARKLNLYNKTVELLAGKPLILWSNTVRIDTKSAQDNFIFAQGNTADSVQSKIVIVITAWPRTAQEIQDEKVFFNKLPQSEVVKLNKGDARSLGSALRNLQSFVAEGSLIDTFGQKVGFVLNRNMLTQSNYNKKLNVEIYSRVKNKPDLLKSTIVDVQGLALMPMNLPQMDVRKTCEKTADCDVLEYVVKISTDKRFLKSEKEYVEVFYKLQYLPNNYEVVQTLLDASTGAKLIKKSFFNNDGGGFKFGDSY